jgi:hypothetical protein
VSFRCENDADVVTDRVAPSHAHCARGSPVPGAAIVVEMVVEGKFAGKTAEWGEVLKPVVVVVVVVVVVAVVVVVVGVVVGAGIVVEIVSASTSPPPVVTRQAVPSAGVLIVVWGAAGTRR